MGKAIGQECEIYDVQVILGPALNIKRDPRCGRNFEYYSEDPLLAGTLAGNFILGVQENNVGACIKHYALNNSENCLTSSRRIPTSLIQRSFIPSFLLCLQVSSRSLNSPALIC